MAVLKLIVQLQVDQTGGNETMERIIENKSGEVKLEEVVPDDRSYFTFEVPSNEKESALRKVVFYRKSGHLTSNLDIPVRLSGQREIPENEGRGVHETRLNQPNRLERNQKTTC